MIRSRRNKNKESLDALSIAQGDVMAALLLIFVIFVVALMVLIAKKTERSAETDVPAWSVWVEIYWQYNDPKTLKLVNVDVDLGVKYRGDKKNRPEEDAVWFSNWGANTYNLERDDLGNRPGFDDWDPINYEVTKSRGRPVGETCVNIHFYRNRSTLSEIPVLVTVRTLKGKTERERSYVSSGSTPILTTQVVLKREWQELNVFCFTLDEKGELMKEKTFQSDSICFRNSDGCMRGMR
jgi:hypothetical protein